MFEVVIYDEKTEQFLNSLRAKLKVKTLFFMALSKKKKTQKTPANEIEKARKILKEIKEKQ